MLCLLYYLVILSVAKYPHHKSVDFFAAACALQPVGSPFYKRLKITMLCLLYYLVILSVAKYLKFKKEIFRLL